jgi:hypothetical protein
MLDYFLTKQTQFRFEAVSFQILDVPPFIPPFPLV